MVSPKELDQSKGPSYIFSRVVPEVLGALCLQRRRATSRVFSEEEAIMRAQQLELIYSQSGMLYEILPDAPWSTFDKTKLKFGPHADGIVGSTQSNPTDQLSNQLQQLSLQQTVASQTSSLTSPTTQMLEVHSVQ
jgi:hypothetical protein